MEFNKYEGISKSGEKIEAKKSLGERLINRINSALKFSKK